MIVEALQLVEELYKFPLIRQVSNPRDAKIWTFDDQWLVQFSKYMVQFNTARPYLREKYDCDDFALRAVTEATDSLLESKTIKDCGHSFCFAEVWQNKPDGNLGGRHALNLVRTNTEWKVYEPQNGEIIPLQSAFDSGQLSVVYWVWL